MVASVVASVCIYCSFCHCFIADLLLVVVIIVFNAIVSCFPPLELTVLNHLIYVLFQFWVETTILWRSLNTLIELFCTPLLCLISNKLTYLAFFISETTFPSLKFDQHTHSSNHSLIRRQYQQLVSSWCCIVGRH